jgi:hypothetical protein
MATNDEMMRGGRRKRVERSAERWARDHMCKTCGIDKRYAGAYRVGEDKLDGLLLNAWLKEGLDVDSAMELSMVTTVCYHTNGV